MLGRSETVIQAFLKNPATYGAQKRPGRPSKLSPAAHRRLIRKAQTGCYSSTQLVRECQISLSASRVRQLLESEPTLRYTKRKSCPKLTKAHIQRRLQWSLEHVEWRDEWNDVIFSDESKFNLDGPDGCQFYWRDMRKDVETCMKRRFGGGSVMVSGAISAKGKSALKILQGNQDADAYVKMSRSRFNFAVDRDNNLHLLVQVFT